MRKSVAPSQLQTVAKRIKVSGGSAGNVSSAVSPPKNTETRRTASDILKLIDNLDEEAKCETSEPEIGPNSPQNPTKTGGDVCDKNYFNVLWCKISTRKHKKWEGDGVLEVKQKSAVLYSLEGKEIASAFGYMNKELSNLDEGSRLKIGGKEVELMSRILKEEFASGKCFTGVVESDGKTIEKQKLPTVFRNPQISPTYRTAKVATPKFDPWAQDALVMPRPKQSFQWKTCDKERGSLSIVDVVVDPKVSKKLRHHQREGVVFLYECVMGMRVEGSRGAILADEMGLGKTLQCIALVWTLHKQGPFGGVPVVKKTLIVTPSSLIKNWKKEFHLWLGKDALNVFTADGSDKIQEYARMPISPVLVLSYELLLRCHEQLEKIPFGLIICDEGHRLKNTTTKTATVLGGLASDRRIVLTGTPLQNDIQEFHAIVEFCNPNFLGNAAKFKRVFGDPIVKSRQPGATEEDKEIGEERACELSRLTNMFVLRRTQEVNNDYLPPKIEFVVFCRPTSQQLDAYRTLISSKMFDSCFCQLSDGALHLSCIMALRKVCNHPALLHSSARDESQAPSDLPRVYPQNYAESIPPEDSGKMRVLAHLISTLDPREKIVLVSAFTKTLDLFAKLCDRENLKFLRLDGTTATTKRQDLVDKFNNPNLNQRVFLLSLKAGGVGLNLNGASKIVLYDIDWNPANDLQAMARIWRDGQKKTVHIYRLLTTGTIEEKMFQRQVMKQGLSGAVIDFKSNRNVHFCAAELKKLFSLNEETACETHDLLGCDCHGLVERLPIVREMRERSCQLNVSKADFSSDKNLTMDDLMSWEHYGKERLADITAEDVSVFRSLPDVTFVFRNAS